MCSRCKLCCITPYRIYPGTQSKDESAKITTVQSSSGEPVSVHTHLENVQVQYHFECLGKDEINNNNKFVILFSVRNVKTLLGSRKSWEIKELRFHLISRIVNTLTATVSHRSVNTFVCVTLMFVRYWCSFVCTVGLLVPGHAFHVQASRLPAFLHPRPTEQWPRLEEHHGDPVWCQRPWRGGT